MASTPAHERPISPSDKRAALDSFANDPSLRPYGTLLGYLVSRDRPDDARLFIDEPGQCTALSLEHLFQKLSHARADAWSLPLFDAAMAHPPVLPKAGEGADDQQLSLYFETFRGREDRASRALDLLIAAYGVELPLRYGQTLLNAVASSAYGPFIQRVLDAGARADKRNAMDELPIDELLSSSSIGSVDASSLRKLATGKIPKVPALAKFLVGAATGGRWVEEKGEYAPRTMDEILAVVRAMIELGASAGPFREVPSPLAAALLLPLSTNERMQVVDALLSAGRAGATLTEALPDVVAGFAPSLLADALDRAGFSAGQTFGRDGRTLLHVAASEGGASFWDGEFVEKQFVPVVKLLIERGERASATNARGKTALDLAKREKSALGDRWKAVEALLRAGGIAAPKGLDRLGDSGLALGVAAALLAEKKLDKKTINRVFRSAEGDDENALESAAVEALLEVPVADVDLASVRTLSFAFDAEIYALLEKATGADAGGESDVLNVASIEGVRMLPGLTELSLTEYAQGVTSLAPLAGHPSLRVLRLAGGRSLEGADALLSLPKLERVLGSDDVEARLGAVAAALIEKGVKVDREKRRAARAREQRA